MRYRFAFLPLIAVVAGVLPYALGTYTMHVANVILIFAVLAIGLGLAMGIGGQVNLAQVAFFGAGAYAVAILTTKAGLGFWVAAVLAVLATTAIGVVVGTPALRVQSHYLGIVTLGLALAFTNWVTNAQIAGGAEGISGIPGPIDNEYLYYYLELGVFAVTLAFGLFIVRTGLGRRMRAMRDDALAAGALGAQVPLLRMTAFLLASLYGGIAGVLYAGLIRYVSPDSFSISTMFLLLAMVIIGGRQSLVGCVTGAIALSVIREVLADHPTVAQLAYGSVVVLVVVFAPNGLAGIPRSLLRRRGVLAARLQPFQPYAVAPAPVASTILEVDDVTKEFRGLRALDGVSLSVRAGEIRGVVGPNGSGKTTLFNVISGFYAPLRGRVSFRGRDMTAAAPYRLSRAGLSRTFQNLRLFADLTVRENILVALDRVSGWEYVVRPVGVLRRDRARRLEADAILARYGLSEFARLRPRTLPYGIQRRVEIARALAASPALLLLDEPAAGLNGEEVRQLSEMVRSIRDSGVTVVLIEHNMGLVMSLCERITVLAGGRIIADGSPAEVVATPAVVEAYLGDSISSEVTR
jgi:branched-chain amino acid transport system permease protein